MENTHIYIYIEVHVKNEIRKAQNLILFNSDIKNLSKRHFPNSNKVDFGLKDQIKKRILAK